MLFSSDEENESSFENNSENNTTREIRPNTEDSGDGLVSSGTLSDSQRGRDFVKGFAQRATEPEIKAIRAKGHFTYEKKAFQEGNSFYEKERQERTSRQDNLDSHAGAMVEEHEEQLDDSSAMESRQSRSLTPGTSFQMSLRSSISTELGGDEAADDGFSGSPGGSPSGRGPDRLERGPDGGSRSSTERYTAAGGVAPPRGRDVSMWGHAGSDAGTSMSSGLSPRRVQPKGRRFNYHSAQSALAWAGEAYSSAQAMRRRGDAPEAFGIVEDMPTRMAYEQLNALAGMAGKVQHVIEHNRRIFQRRVEAGDRSELARAFKAWRAARYGTVRKQQLVTRAAARIARGTLSRAFLSWKDKFHLVDKYLIMKRKGIAVMERGRQRRAFLEWRGLVEERWWKEQIRMRETDNDRLNRLCRKYENRPVKILGGRRQRACLREWRGQAWERIRRRMLLKRAVARMARRKTAAAFASWIAFHDIKRRRKENLQRAVGRMRNRRRTLAWNSWLDWIDSKRRKQLRLIKAVRHWQLQSASKSWNSWQAYMQERRKHRRILKHWTSRHMSKAWRRWVELVYTRRRHRLILSRSVARMRRKGMVEAWDAWLGAIDDRCHAELCAHRDALDEEAQSLRAENERLRRDNERFVRLIDSGEWGRGRVAELVQAGEVMKGERDALMKLIGSLRREYEAVQEAKLAQESELAEIKKRITGGGGAGRNRLLVKGGSSFNGLVRAMKAEMAQAAETGKPVDPNRIYEIDRLSMDHVQVYPDGELSVQGFDKDATRTGRFSRPLPVGQHRRTRMLPSPQPQHYSMSSKSPGPSPLSSSRQTQASPEGQPWSRITRALDSRIARNRKLGNSDASSNQ